MLVNQYIGVDVSKSTFDVCFGDGVPVKKFSNTEAGMRQFFRMIESRCTSQTTGEQTKTVIGVESTGIYHLLLCMRATEAGYTVRLMNPLITNKYSQRSIRKAKTDKIDARIIWACAIEREGYVFHETNDTLTMKHLVREREYLATLKRILTMREANTMVKSQAIRSELPSVSTDLISLVEEKMKASEKQLRHYRTDEQKLIQTIPGVGPLTAAACISEIQDITRFVKPKQLIAFIGIDPKVHQSGSSIDKYRRISKRGNTILRTRLYNACSVAVLQTNQFKTYFQKKKSEGKPYRVALVATMNKMVRVIHSVWTQKQAYREPTGHE